jgi:hypothetical protein
LKFIAWDPNLIDMEEDDGEGFGGDDGDMIEDDDFGGLYV